MRDERTSEQASEATIEVPPSDDPRADGSPERPEEPAEGAAGGGPGEDPGADAPEAGPGPGEGRSDAELVERAFALLFAAPDPLSLGRLVQLLERPRRERVRAALEGVRERIAESALPLELRELAGGYRLFTSPEQADTVAGLVRARTAERITPAALETLAIVAYRQPVTKAEIEAIRGVQAGPILRALVDRGLVRVLGRADQPGAPLEYGTTKEFLDRFGLARIDDLPRDAELAKD